MHDALRGVRAQRAHALLGGLGIAMAAAMLATAATVSYGLATGFSRSARAADLPDVIARFEREPTTMIARRIAALPDLAAFTLSREFTGVPLSAGSHESDNGVVEEIGPGRRGYAIVAGHDISGATSGVVLEQGVASSWGLRVGEEIEVGGLGPQLIVGLAQEPDDVAYPLAAPRLYIAQGALALGIPKVAVGPNGPQYVRQLRAPPAAAGPNGPRVAPGPGAPPAAIGQPNVGRVAQRPHIPLAEVLRALETRRRAALKEGAGEVNVAEIWLRDPSQLDTVLVQARALSYGLRNLRFLTRSGVRVLLDEAAGIVIALLGALSAIALLTAGVMLAASARAEVQRRLRAIGVRRAIGSTRAHVALLSALEAMIVAVPAGALGVTAGALAVSGADNRLLALLNERGPGSALALPLAGCFALSVLVPTLTSTWPAWRAAGRSPVQLLRGAELHPSGRSAPRPRRGGLARLGGRLVAARRVRAAATLTMLGVSAAFILLMLALASELSTLENDPKALGRRYQLTASLPPSNAARIRSILGVVAAAPRYEVTALDTYSLGETVDVIAYPGDHTEFEAPPLSEGRRLRGNGDAEVGTGLAQVLGLGVGSTLALALPSGRELRLRVSGIVGSLDHDGRVAYVPAAALLTEEPSAPEQIAVRLEPGTNASRVAAEIGVTGVSRTKTITGEGNTLVAALTAVLRAVAVIDGLVCLYAVMQALALVADERRGTIAVLRACGAGTGAVRRLLTGAALVVVVPTALLAVLLERLVLGPEMGRIAAGYVSLALAASPREIALVVVGLALLGALAVWWVARRACREPIVAGLP